jgi:hypothetical protein
MVWLAACAATGGDAEDNNNQQQQQRSGQHYPGREITYAEFVSVGMWSKMTKGLKKEEKACLKAPLVYAELMSYIYQGVQGYVRACGAEERCMVLVLVG